METKMKRIGTRTYSAAEMPTLKALDVFEELVALVGPGLTALMVAGPEGRADDAVKLLFSGLGGKKLRRFVEQMLPEVQVEEDGKTLPMLTGFDLRYAGRLFEVFEVLAFVVEINYRDFFDIAAARLRELLKRMGPDSSSPTP